MTLTEAERLLSENGIVYERNERTYSPVQYWFNIRLSSKNTAPITNKLLVIRNAIHQKNIELIFNEVDGDDLFENLYFGDYDYEMFHYNEEMLPFDLIENIQCAMSGKMHIISATDLRRERWLFDGSYLESDDDTLDNMEEFNKTLNRIERKKSWLSKLLRRQTKYEIYDWNTYRCIIK